ncbi:MAG TPA: SGNH/GDSL hydrolase family protein [Acetobacteraceae bacterium]|nr:SGNH/GDSL hydrolase family protein [Acetobacteraceae bacterium]
MFAAAEVVSRIMFVQHEADACMMPDRVLGTRFRPDCTSRVKAAEGPWVTNRYNECGYRTPQSCGPKPAGGVRIAVLGSSISQGYLVPYEQTFAARDATLLTQSCRKPVEFQNLASIGYIWNRLADRVDDAIALHPDAAVIVIVPFDLQQTAVPAADRPADRQGEDPGVLKRLDGLVTNSRAVIVAQHFLFRQPDLYVKLYLDYGDRADFLRPPFPPAWQDRLKRFDQLMAEIAGKFHAAGIPLILAYVPERAQAALLSAHQSPPGVDPYAFPRQIGDIARAHGIRFVDLSPTMSRMQDAANLYYPVDGHLAGQGDKLLADALAQKLRDTVPALAECRPDTFALGQSTQ